MNGGRTHRIRAFHIGHRTQSFKRNEYIRREIRDVTRKQFDYVSDFLSVKSMQVALNADRISLNILTVLIFQ